MITVSYDWAQTYFAARLYSERWTADSVTQENRQKALSMAGYMIEGAFTFPDGTFSTNDDNEIVFSDQIKAAVCEQALWCLKQDPTSYPNILMKGFIEAETGTNTSIKLDKSMVAPYICQAAISLIGSLGDLIKPTEIGKTHSFPLRG